MKLLATMLLCLGLLAGFSRPAGAARFHVLQGGQRTSGPSLPDDWSPANCYPNLVAARLAAGDADTLLLSYGDHVLRTPLTLPAMLAGQDLLLPAADDCRLCLGGDGALQIAAAAEATVVRGVSLITNVAPTTAPALRILPPGQPGAAVRVESCLFGGLTGAGTWGTGGSAIHAGGGGQRLDLTITDSRFLDCRSDQRGGAIYAGDGVDLLLQGCVFERNEARFAGNTVLGGALALYGEEAGSSLTLEDCTFLDSVCWGPGGAIYVQDADLTMRDTEVRGSRSAVGGITNWSAGAGVFMRRIRAEPATFAFVAERCAFIDNDGDLTLGPLAGDGGGVMLRGGDSGGMIEASVADCLFEDNFNDQGAGLYIGRGAVGTVERTLFLNNTALRNGGGSYKGGELIGNMGETALYLYCVFAGNRAGWDQDGQPYPLEGGGGAFMTRRSPRAEFHHCTFADNLAGPVVSRGDAIHNWSEGSGFIFDLQRLRLVNCLFYGTEQNDVQIRSDANGFTEILNCAWEPGQIAAAGVAPAGTVLLGGVPFAVDEGWQLDPQSPCIDAAQPLGYERDLEGTPVPVGLGPDIGAYERLYAVGVADLPPGGAAAALGLSPAWPNPANPRTEIAFTLARPATARLTVHDAAGRLTAVLHEGFLPQGEHRAAWNGRTLAGGEAPSGLYLVRLEAGGEAAGRKIMLVR